MSWGAFISKGWIQIGNASGEFSGFRDGFVWKLKDSGQFGWSLRIFYVFGVSPKFLWAKKIAKFERKLKWSGEIFRGL